MYSGLTVPPSLLALADEVMNNDPFLLHCMSPLLCRFSDAGNDETYPRAAAAGVRKAPRHEIAGCGAPAVPQALWGFGRGVSVEDVEVRRRIRSLFLEAWACVSG